MFITSYIVLKNNTIFSCLWAQCKRLTKIDHYNMTNINGVQNSVNENSSYFLKYIKSQRQNNALPCSV